jgi:hypothetical protein
MKNILKEWNWMQVVRKKITNGDKNSKKTQGFSKALKVQTITRTKTT